MKRVGHWQDYVSIAMGAWLIVSPWVLGIHAPLQAIGNFVAIGVVLGAFAHTEVFVPEAWEEWSELVMGLWLIGSPWVLEFRDVPVAMQNAVASGLVVSVLAVWVIFTDGAFSGWIRRRSP